jgi:hypothetical protein
MVSPLLRVLPRGWLAAVEHWQSESRPAPIPDWFGFVRWLVMQRNRAWDRYTFDVKPNNRAGWRTADTGLLAQHH